MHLSRASAWDFAPPEGTRGVYPTFSIGKVGRRGVFGESLRQPSMCLWAHVSQKFGEYRLCIAKRSRASVDILRGILAGLAPRVAEYHVAGDARAPDWRRAH
eukprot:911535-Pyramimonas_sp.AAC.1